MPQKRKSSLYFLFFKRFLYSVFLFLVLTWLILPWIIRFPALQELLRTKIAKFLNPTFTFSSVTLSHFGEIVFLQVSYELPMQEKILALSSPRIKLSRYLSDEPQVEVYDFLAKKGSFNLASAGRGTIIFPNGLQEPTISLRLEQSFLDLEAMDFLFAKNKEKESDATVFPNIVEVSVHDSRMRFPGIDHEFHWHGSLQSLGEKEKKNCDVILTPMDHPSQQLQIHIRFDPFPSTVNILQATGKSFSVASTQSFPFKGIIDGHFFFDQIRQNQYEFKIASGIQDVSTEITDGFSIRLPQSQIVASALTTNLFTLRTATAEIQHSSFELQHQEKWNIPAGYASFSYTSPIDAEENVSGLWNIEPYGTFHFSSNRLLTAATQPLKVTFAVQDFSLHRLPTLLPESYTTTVTPLRGLWSAKGELSENIQNEIQYTASSHVEKGSYQSDSVRITNLAATAHLEGNTTEHRGTVQGNGSLSFAIDTEREFQVETVELKTNYQYNNDNEKYNIQVNEGKSSILPSFQGEYDSTGRIAFEGILPLDTQLKPILSQIIPHITREIEGSGDLHISIQGEPETYQVEMSCPELVVYSFDRDPAFGVQLQQLNIQSRFEKELQHTVVHSTIQAGSPYFSYDGNDCEWPGKSIILDSTLPFDSPRMNQISVHPPGGGTVHIKQQAERIEIRFADLDLKTFVFPLVNRFLLEKEEFDKEEDWTIDGKMNGWVTIHTKEGEHHSKGVITFHQVHVSYQGNISCEIKNAEIAIPFSYPLAFPELPQQEIRFSAKSIRLDQETYSNLSARIPIDETAITFPEQISLSLFGGLWQWRNIQIKNWQTSKPELSGSVKIENMQILAEKKESSKQSKRGTLSGEIRQIVVSEDLLSVSGELRIHMFDGLFLIRSLFLQYPFTDYQVIGFDGEMENIDLESLTDYFHFGHMTGVISGKLQNIQVIVPSGGSNELPTPIHFDIKVQSVMKGDGTISKETLGKIVDLGQTPGLAKDMIQRDAYRYSALGLRAKLDGDNLQLYGTLKNNYFLAPSSSLFANKISITLAKPDDIIPFRQFWNRLRSQIQE